MLRHGGGQKLSLSISEQKMTQKETGRVLGRGSLEAERLELTGKKEANICRELRIKGGY